MLKLGTELPMTYKHWKWLYLAQFTVFPLLVFLIALISLKCLGSFLPAFVAGGLWCLMFVVVSLRLVLWRCRVGVTSEGEFSTSQNAAADPTPVRIARGR